MKISRMIIGWIVTTIWVVILTGLTAYVAGSITGLEFDLSSILFVGVGAGFLTVILGEIISVGKVENSTGH